MGATWTDATGGVTAPRGFRAAAVTCGIKESGKPDLALLVGPETGTAAATFTTNRVTAAPVRLAVVFAGLAILPSLLIMTTSLTRIVIVLAFVRRALTTQNIPPTIAIVGLSLFLTIFTMSPTLADIHEQAMVPYSNKQISFEVAVDRVGVPVHDWIDVGAVGVEGDSMGHGQRGRVAER